MRIFRTALRRYMHNAHSAHIPKNETEEQQGKMCRKAEAKQKKLKEKQQKME